MEKIYSQNNMNIQPHPLEHLLFICVMFLNWVCIKLVSFAGIADLLEILIIVPLKIVLPVATTYIAYQDKWHKLGRDIKAFFKKKKK